jgi:hypothetical protein
MADEAKLSTKFDDPSAVPQDQRARQKGDLDRDRDVFLQTVEDELGRAGLDEERILKQIANLMVRSVADWCLVDVIGEGGAIRRVTGIHRDPLNAHRATELVNSSFA